MKFYLVIFSLACFWSCKDGGDTQSLKVSGTVVFVGKSTGCMIMASDTRSVITHHGTPIAYLDSNPKIFKLKQFLVGQIGNGNLGEEFFKRIIQEFDDYFPQNQSVQYTFQSFLDFLKALYPDVFDRRIVEFYGAGYENDIPIMIKTDSLGRANILYADTIAMTSNLPLGSYVSPMATYPETPKDMMYEFERLINAQAENESISAGIGKPVTIAKIDSNNNVTFIKNDFREKAPNVMRELILAMADSSKKIHYVTNDSKHIIDSICKNYLSTKKGIEQGDNN